VPTLQCGLLRSNFSLAMANSSSSASYEAMFHLAGT
jgi:hypothetical protein